MAIVRWEALGLAAQGTGPLPPGQRIRVVSRELGGQTLTGRLLAIDDETLLLKVADRAEPIRLRRASIGQIEVSRGKRTGAGKGALIGGVALGIPGAFVGWYGTESCVEVLSCTPGHVYGGFASAAIGGLVVGGAIGALIGSAFTSERWERVPISVAVAPQRRGARAALTLRF